ncbi:MAG: hypothetical protein AAGC81_02435 [Pseudomonadota bacterium]
MNKEEAKDVIAEVAASTTPTESLAHGITIAAVAGILPAIASALSIILIALKIWETETVKRITRRDRSSTDGGE